MHSFKVILQVFYPLFRNTYSKVSTVYLFMTASIDWYTTKRNQIFNQETLSLEILSLVKLLQYHIQIKDTLGHTKKPGVPNKKKGVAFCKSINFDGLCGFRVLFQTTEIFNIQEITIFLTAVSKS